MSRRNRRQVDETDLWGVLGLATPPAPDMVDAQPARDHARQLVCNGWGTRSLAERAGVSRHTMQGLLYGRTRHDRPTRRVLPDTAHRVLSIGLGEVPPCHRKAA